MTRQQFYEKHSEELKMFCKEAYQCKDLESIFHKEIGGLKFQILKLKDMFIHCSYDYFRLPE